MARMLVVKPVIVAGTIFSVLIAYFAEVTQWDNYYLPESSKIHRRAVKSGQ